MGFHSSVFAPARLLALTPILCRADVGILDRTIIFALFVSSWAFASPGILNCVPGLDIVPSHDGVGCFQNYFLGAPPSKGR
jgi:hypothetical protein